METQASLKQAIESLPPVTKWLIGGFLFVGCTSIAINSGFFSWAGLKVMAISVTIVAMIIFAVCSVEEKTRQYFWDLKEMVWQLILKNIDEATKARKEKETVPA